MTDKMRGYYASNPLMVSSPFGGVTGIDHALVARVFTQLDINMTGCRVLDVGCGRGYMAEVVEAAGGTYAGVDLVATQTETPRVYPFALADAARLPYDAGHFDLVVCVDAFEHFPDGRAAAREFSRVLRPGGIVFLSVPNYANVAGLVKWWCEHWGAYERDSWAPFRQWQPQELEHALRPGRVRQAFRRAGFTRGRYVPLVEEAGLGLFPWLAHPRMPEALLYRLQRLFALVGPSLTRLCPSASLHHFWKWEKP